MQKLEQKFKRKRRYIERVTYKKERRIEREKNDGMKKDKESKEQKI